MLVKGYTDDMQHPNITNISGWAKFSGKNCIEVNGNNYTADHIIIAPGSKPQSMPNNIIGKEYVITSDGFFELEKQPNKVVVFGAGYIACELAGVFNALGSEVHQIFRADMPLRGFDMMIRKT